MKVTQEKLPASQVGLQIEISAETTKQSYDKVVQNLASSSNIPGFRKGKVPRQVVIQRFGIKRLKAAALEEIIQESLKNALEQEKIEFLGNYQLRSNFDELIERYEPGKPFNFEAAVDVSPVVEVKDYQGLTVKAEEAPYEASQVDQVLKEKQETKAIEIVVEERGAEIGDIAYIDYEVFAADESGQPGAKMDGVEGRDFKVEMIEDQFIPGFIAGIVGMKPEETKQLPLTFPEDYGNQELAAKSVVFSITLKELKAKELPSLDDEFAKEISEFETIEELRASLEQQFKEKAEKETKNNVHKAILASLVEQTEIELPESLIQDEVTNILTQTAMQMQQFGIDPKQLFSRDAIPQMRERSRPEAITRIKQSLIIAAIAKQEGINSSEEEVQTKIEEVRGQLKDSEIDYDRLNQLVVEEIVTEKTMTWLEGKTQVELLPPGSLKPTEEEKTSDEEE